MIEKGLEKIYCLFIQLIVVVSGGIHSDLPDLDTGTGTSDGGPFCSAFTVCFFFFFPTTILAISSCIISQLLEAANHTDKNIKFKDAPICIGFGVCDLWNKFSFFTYSKIELYKSKPNRININEWTFRIEFSSLAITLRRTAYEVNEINTVQNPFKNVRLNENMDWFFQWSKCIWRGARKER